MTDPPSIFCLKGEILYGPKIFTSKMWYKQSSEKWNSKGRIFFFRAINFLETSQSILPTSLNLILSKILLCKVDGYFYNSKIWVIYKVMYEEQRES